MKIRSFRLRIALLAATLAGSALAGFGIVAWQLIYVAKVNRLDAKLENQVRRSARPRPQDRWQPFAASLPREVGTDTDSVALLVLDAEGKPLYQSPHWSAELNLGSVFPPRPAFVPPPPPTNGERLERSPDRRFPEPPAIATNIVTQRTSSGSWRLGAASFPYTQVAIAVSLEAIDQEMAVIRNIFIVVIPGTLLLVAGGAWGLSGSALRPIRRLTTAMQQVTVTGLNQQVPIGSTDVEFVELIQVFNQMLERLERSFKQASRFSADAAHELKTPLAILQGELEQTLQQAEPGSAMQQSLSSLLDEVRRLSGIVRKLLLLSLADAGRMSLHRVEVNLSAILAQMQEDLELLAPQLEVKTDIAPQLRVQGDRDLLTQVCQNLISNAIKYNLPNGWIRIQARQQGTMVILTITNASKDIPESDRERIFERFYRGDRARTRKVEGIGLGLSLSREIARAHRGNLTLEKTLIGQTAFTLTLPGSVGA